MCSTSLPTLALVSSRSSRLVLFAWIFGSIALLFVLPFIERNQAAWMGHAVPVTGDKIDRLTSYDLYAMLGSFYRTPELWGGVIAAALLLAAAMWVRRYRDETA